jgi:aryl-alcohol dehydrogenase-like predicted oxidoreductase
MATKKLPDDKVLQAGLSAGGSATAGIHSNKPKPVPDEFTGKNTLPQSFCPGPKDRYEAKAPDGQTIKVSPLCIGAWPWGDTATFHWKEEELPNVKAAWKYMYESGINFIDTASSYGNGRSEQIIGELVRGLPRESFVIQTKYLGVPLSPENYIHPVDAPAKQCQASLERLGLEYVDIYMVHGPIHPQSIKSIAKGMEKVVDMGLAKAIACSNYDKDEMIKFYDALAEYGIPLAAYQVEYNVLRRVPEIKGEIAECQKHGILFQSYSSLAQGRLSGKYSVENPPPATYKFSNYPMEEIEPVLRVLRLIAQKREKPVAAVALNWNISKGALPLVGIRNEQQAKEDVQALGWRLTEEEVAEIDRVSFLGRTSILWQHG